MPKKTEERTDKSRRVILMPKGRGKLSIAEIDRAVRKVKALREQREKERAAPDGKK